MRAFFEDMLQFEMFEDVAKDPIIYPAYNSVVAADAQEQTLRTITDHLIAKKGDYRDLFTTQTTFLTRALGRVYKLPVATRNGWESRGIPGRQRTLGHSDRRQLSRAATRIRAVPRRRCAARRFAKSSCARRCRIRRRMWISAPSI